MDISDRKQGDVAIVRVSGQIKFGAISERFARHVDDLIGRGERKLVIDMLDVPWMDTAGINATVACMKHLKDRDETGEIKLVLGGKSRELFLFYELHRVLEIHEDVEAAVAAFAR
jgi:anti-sigma B factor antagonist